MLDPRGRRSAGIIAWQGIDEFLDFHHVLAAVGVPPRCGKVSGPIAVVAFVVVQARQKPKLFRLKPE
jgi:hypothetical protein